MKSITQKLCMIVACFVGGLWCACPSWSATLVTGRVEAMQEDGTIMLDGGQAIRLADWVFPTQNTQEFAAQIIGEEVTCTQADTDRYGVAICYLYDATGALLTPDSGAMAYSDVTYTHTLQALHRDAQTQFSCDAKDGGEYLNQYRTVTGIVYSVAVRRQVVYLNFGPDYKNDFTISVAGAAMRSRSANQWQALAGKKIVVRGWIHAYNGPHISLLNPDMLYVTTSSHNPD